jgi:hypothetical protein
MGSELPCFRTADFEVRKSVKFPGCILAGVETLVHFFFERTTLSD